MGSHYKKLYDIKKEVCRVFQLDADLIDKRTKKGDVSVVRQVCQWTAYYYTNESTTQIGWYFGRRNHATVIHSVREINRSIEDNYDTACKIKIILSSIRCKGFELLNPNGRGVAKGMEIQTRFKDKQNEIKIEQARPVMPNLRERLIRERNKFLSTHDTLKIKREIIEKCNDVNMVAALAKEIAQLEKMQQAVL